LYTMLVVFFSIGCRVKSPPSFLFLKRARPCLEKLGEGALNYTKHKQILKARNTKTSALQPKNRRDKACRIELADLG